MNAIDEIVSQALLAHEKVLADHGWTSVDPDAMMLIQVAIRWGIDQTLDVVEQIIEEEWAEFGDLANARIKALRK